MQKPWQVLSTAALGGVLLIGMVVPALAANGDIVDTKTGTIYQATNYNTKTATYNTMLNQIITGTPNEFTYEFEGNQLKLDDYSALVTMLIGKGETLWQAKIDAATKLTTAPGAVKAIDITKSVAI
jgi:hypothetical protein